MEGQFRLVGEEDLDASESEEDVVDVKRKPSYRQVNGLHRVDSEADAHELDSIMHLPTYASTHSAAETRLETRALEKKVAQDPSLIDIEREEHNLEGEMIESLKVTADGPQGDLYNAIDRAKRE